MNIKGISLTIGMLTVVLSTTAPINTAQASSLFDTITLLEASKLLGKEDKVSSKKIKYSKRKRRVSCDSYSQQTLYKKASKYRDEIDDAARDYNVSPSLIMAVITVESCFRSSVRSSQGAAGLMQLMPGTAKRFGTKNRYNPQQNIKAGTRYLKFLLTRFNGDVKLTAAAYNAGEGSVDKYNGIPPYKETQTYVVKVLKTYRKLSSTKNTYQRNEIAVKAAINLKKTPNRSKDLVFSDPEWQHINKLLAPEKSTTTLSFKQFL